MPSPMHVTKDGVRLPSNRPDGADVIYVARNTYGNEED